MFGHKQFLKILHHLKTLSMHQFWRKNHNSMKSHTLILPNLSQMVSYVGMLPWLLSQCSNTHSTPHALTRYQVYQDPWLFFLSKLWHVSLPACHTLSQTHIHPYLSSFGRKGKQDKKKKMRFNSVKSYFIGTNLSRDILVT